jgi:membrane protease YdiL (CAAX protease family)
MKNPHASQEENPNTPEPRFCHYCGEPLQPGTTTCPACNPSLKPAAAEPAGQPSRDAPHSSEEGEFRKAFVLYGLLLASSALIFLTPFDEEDFLDRILVFDSIMVVIVLVMVSLSWKTIAQALPGPVRLPHLGLAVAIAACTFGAALLYSRVLVPLLPEDLPNIVDVLMRTGLPKWQQLVIIAVIPAVFEELAFRGLVLPFLTHRMPAVHAVVVSSAAFAILHMDWVSMPFLFGMGLSLGWLRVASGSLLPPMLVHFFHNAAIWVVETVN